MKFTYDYPRPAVTVDAVLLRKAVSAPEILLIRRRFSPFAGLWALPGGFINEDEDLLDAIHRELAEETGLSTDNLRQFRTYGHPKRDPRHHTITVVFIGWIEENQEPSAGDDASEVCWFSLNLLPELAFDHAEIISDVVENEKIVL
jgi:8-oxo-dGTP diphosphatase